MTAIEKKLIRNVLQLPRDMRIALAERLIESLDETEIKKGARLAHDRIKAAKAGKTNTVSEQEILDMLEKGPA